MWLIPRRASRLPAENYGKLLINRVFYGNRSLRTRPSHGQSGSENESTRSSSQDPDGESSKIAAVSRELHRAANSTENSLLSPVHIPEDPHGVLKENHPATSILRNSAIVIQRQIEMMNILVGFEQANRYIIMDPQGNHVGFLAEQDHGLGNAMARQMFRTHRSFTTHVFDKDEREILRFHRPFSWISSKIRVHDAAGHTSPVSSVSSTALEGTGPGSLVNQTTAQISPLQPSEMPIIGEAHQQWAPLRRKYNLFLHRDLEKLERFKETPQLTSGQLPLSGTTKLQLRGNDQLELGFAQFAYINEPFLSWDFTLLSSDNHMIGSVSRNFSGLAREIFTDTGVYALRMDAAGLAVDSPQDQQAHNNAVETIPGMTLDQRAVMLATAVSIDFDYFSRHSNSSGLGFMPLWFPIGGEAAGAGGAAAGGAAAGEIGAAEAGAGAVGSAARGAAAMEGMTAGAAGAGTMAGYEAMQRGMQGQAAQDDASPVAHDPYSGQPHQQTDQQDAWGIQNDPWSGGNDPWGGNNNNGNTEDWNQSQDGQSGGEGGEGGSFFDDWL